MGANAELIDIIGTEHVTYHADVPALPRQTLRLQEIIESRDGQRDGKLVLAKSTCLRQAEPDAVPSGSAHWEESMESLNAALAASFHIEPQRIALITTDLQIDRLDGSAGSAGAVTGTTCLCGDGTSGACVIGW